MATKTDRFTRRRARSLLVKFPLAIPVVAVVLVFLVTALSLVALQRAEAQRHSALIEQLATQKSGALSQTVIGATSVLEMGSVVLSGTEEVNPVAARQFASAILDNLEASGASEAGWASWNPADPSVLSIRFILPGHAAETGSVGDERQAGTLVRRALADALLTSRPTATGHILKSVDDRDASRQFMIVMPIVREGQRNNDTADFLFISFNAQRFFDAALRLIELDELVKSGKVTIQLYDGPASSGDLLASSTSGLPPGKMFQRKLDLANRSMTLAIWSSQQTDLSKLSWVILLAGITAAALMYFILRLLARQAREDRRALDRMVEQNSIRDSLTRELNHRVKNTLANVLSIIALTRRRADDVESFAQGLEGRVRALSATHDLLTQSEWGTTPIADVIKVELASYIGDDAHSVEISGPDLELAPKDALSLGLALHELTTNASKYGSLSRAGGRISITWSPVSEALAKVMWVESGGPPVTSPSHGGFGMDLIEKITAHELRHPVDLQFDESGVRCVFLVPVRDTADFLIRSGSISEYA